eukprot:631595_1
MARNLTRLLCDRIDNAQSVHDMLPLLSLIPLQVIREVIVDTIRDLDTDIVNKMQYTCLSMTEIIPCDVIQQIVSFTDSLHLKYVDKTFNVAHNRNQTLHGLSQRQNIIDQYSFAPTLKHGAATWIIHPTRTHLTSDEIANRYQGPLNTFMDVMNAARSGDKLLFHDGNYGSTDEYDIILQLIGFENLNNLQLIGLGDNVSLTQGDLKIQMHQYHNVYFKNIKIICTNEISIGGHSRVSMEDCEIVTCKNIEVCEPAAFNAKNCVFSATAQRNEEYPIQVQYGSHVNIVGCTFTHHNKTSNIFKDNLGYPIAVDVSGEPKRSRKLEIRLNILEGYNGISANDTVDSANKIY